MSLGIYLFFALFQLRVYLYISIFNWKRRAKGVYLWVPIGYHVAVPLAYAIVAAALPQSLGYGYSPDTYTCMNHDAIYYIGIGLTAFQFLISAGLTFKARKINTCFNEFREFVIILAIAMVAGVLSICTRMMSGWQDRSYTVDALDTAAEFIPAQAYFFVVLGPPIYHSIVDKDEYLAYFMRKMLKANLVRQYDMSYTGQLTGTNGFGLGSGADSSVTNRVPGHNITEGRHSRFKELSSTHNTESLEQHQDLTLV
ncbi:hypothetical protein GQ54DRAFT_307516 [Martensiomyces pterosporus]|nr:hypothetical protein GQ54DRAFT_307516 [Martensiomyces pterosporus]